MGSPSVSVVIASNGSPELFECLSALRRQEFAEPLEIIVAESSRESIRTMDALHPDVHVVPFDGPHDLAVMRGATLSVARGEIIARLDPFSIVDDRWLAELKRAHAERPEPVIGGVVELHEALRGRFGHWVTFFFEFGSFLPPVARGPVDGVPGCNVSYKRSALERVGATRGGPFWMTFANLELGPGAMWIEPSLVVRLRKPIALHRYIRSRFDHGRCYAAKRVAARPRATRLARALTTPLLPFLLAWRMARGYWSKRLPFGPLLTALPVLTLTHASWSLGELAGYLGGPGESCGKLYD